MKFDDILQHYLGEFGPYQKRIYFFVCIPAIFASIFTMLPVFILITPDHRCHLKGLDNDTFAFQSEAHKYLVNASIPTELDDDGEERLSKCFTFVMNGTKTGNESKTTCNRWVYETSKTTAVSEFNMVCDYAIYQSHFKMITFVGGLIGAGVNGLMSDLFGRKKVFLICLCCYMIVVVVQILSPNYILFLAMRFLQGLFGIGIFMITFVMVMELVGPNYRMLAGMVIEFFWCAGLFILVAVAYLVPTWKFLLLAVSLPAFGLLSYIWIIPESPRWLLSRGRFDEAEQVLIKMASVNGTEMPDRFLLEEAKDGDKTDTSKQQETGHVWKLFTHKVLLVRMIIIFFNRFTLNMTYYGLWLNIASLSGDPYFNFTVSTVVEVLANLLIVFLINRHGRKKLYCGSMLVSATGFLITLFPIYIGDADDFVYALGLIMVGKFGISAAYSIIYIYITELVPTSLRNSAMGVSQCIEVFGGVLCPYIIDVGNLLDEKSSKAFPMIVFGSFTLVALLLSLLLPETRNKQLPETVDEAVRFGQHEEL